MIPYSILIWVNQNRGKKTRSTCGREARFNFELGTYVLAENRNIPCTIVQEHFKPVYIRLTLHGKPREVSTQVKVLPSKWDNVLKEVKGRSKKAMIANDEIDECKLEIKAILKEFGKKHQPFTMKDFNYYYSGKHLIPQKRLMYSEVLASFNEKNRRLSYGTKKTYQAYQNTIQKYMKSNLGVADMDIEMMNTPLFYSNLATHLANNMVDTSARIIALHFKAILDHATYLNENLVVHKKIQDYKFYVKTKNPYRYHSPEEIAQIEGEAERIGIDIKEKLSLYTYLLQCEIGSAWADLKKLTEEHIDLDKDGYKWVRHYRKKSVQYYLSPFSANAFKYAHILSEFRHFRKDRRKNESFLIPYHNYQTHRDNLTTIGRRLNLL